MKQFNAQDSVTNWLKWIMENHISLIRFYFSNCCDTDAGTEDFLCAKNIQKSLFGSCSYLSNRSRTPELLSHIIHQTRHRNVFVVLCFNPVLEPLRSAYSLCGYGRHSRDESLPIVNPLFSVHAERLSTPVMPQNSFIEEKKVTLTRTVNSSQVPAATDWSCLMVAVGESACVENWSWQNKENLWGAWQLSLLDPFKDAKLDPPPFQPDKFSTWLLIIFSPASLHAVCSLQQFHSPLADFFCSSWSQSLCPFWPFLNTFALIYKI